MNKGRAVEWTATSNASRKYEYLKDYTRRIK